MDVSLMRRLFELNGYRVTEYSYEEMSTRVATINGSIILYSSSQTPGYRNFIEDILVSLQLQGNRLLPSFKMFRAHENKGFQELLKQLYSIESVPGRYFSGWRFHGDAAEMEFPCVLKWTEGSRSHGVQLLRNRKELQVRVSKRERLSSGIRLYAAAKKYLYPRKYNKLWYEMIRPRKRFVLQKFVSGLSFDYKIIAFGDKFFCLKRAVRRGDFRASGSGHREFVKPPLELLCFSREILAKLDEPFVSLDVCQTDTGFGLLEFQGVHFGPFTVVKAPFCYRANGDEWELVPGPFNLEHLVVEAICRQLRAESDVADLLNG
jgi:glutathione synthase/RimK-type ligase-like ATP-grasp enzyme